MKNKRKGLKAGQKKSSVLQKLMPTPRAQLIKRIISLWERATEIQWIGWTAIMRPEAHALALVVSSTQGEPVKDWKAEVNWRYNDTAHGGDGLRSDIHTEVRYLREGIIIKQGLGQAKGQVWSEFTDKGLGEAYDRLLYHFESMNAMMGEDLKRIKEQGSVGQDKAE